MQRIMKQLAVSLLIGGLVLFASAPAGAWVVPGDFITGGGWYIIQNHLYPFPPFAVPGGRASFGWHGGVKNGDWWGNGNYIDHGFTPSLQIHSLFVSGYVKTEGSTDGVDEKGRRTGTRDICGRANAKSGSTDYGEYWYRVRMKDTGEPGRRDRFGISLYNDSGTLVYMSWGSLGDPYPGGGNIQLHKGNRSNAAPPPGTPNKCEELPDHFNWT